MTKKNRGYWERYCECVSRHSLRGLSSVYKKPSVYKKSIWLSIKNDCAKLKGHALSIIGSSCFVFSCGFIYQQDNKTIFRYYSQCSTLDIELDQECIALGKEKKVIW